jgi:hypothetical protein
MSDITLSLGTIVSVTLAFLGFVAGVAKLFVMQQDRRISTIKAEHERRQKELEKAVHRLELDFANFRGELPLFFVMRDDYVRNQSVFEAKLDGLATKIEGLAVALGST